MRFKIFGQEPAFIVSVVEAGLVMLLSFGLFDLDQNKVGVIVACTSAGLGLVVAYATSTTVYTAFVGFAKALLQLAITFGLHLSDAQTASAIAFVTLVIGLFLRQTTNSTETQVSASSPGDKKEALELLALKDTAPTTVQLTGTMPTPTIQTA